MAKIERKSSGESVEVPSLEPRFAEAGLRTFEPRIVFQVKPLTEGQRKGLQTVLFILRMLEARVRAAGSLRRAAISMGVSKSFLSNVLRGKKPPGYHLARMVGYVPKTLYIRVTDEAGTPLKVMGTRDDREAERKAMRQRRATFAYRARTTVELQDRERPSTENPGS